MSNEDGSEDRLTKCEFAELIQHLSVQEILAIEYCIGTNWCKLFSRKNVSTQIIVCNLCVLEASSFKNLLAHIDGRKHKLQMERVKQLYHPDYTYPKNNNKEIEKPFTKKSTENVSTSPIIKVVPNTLNQPTVVADNEKEKLDNTILQSKTKNKTHIVRSCENSENNKTAVKSIAMKTSADVENKSKISAAGSLCTEKQKVEDCSTLCSATNIQYGVKNSKEISQRQASEKSKSEKTSKKEQLNSEKIPEKRVLLDNKTGETSEELGAKKTKIVINPAAALSLKAGTEKATKIKNEEDEKERPQYQTDKIIVPTMHKNKLQNEKTPSSKNQSSDLPKFSVKWYSSKPTDNDIHGILGVEYVIKILKSRNDISPRYECGLCELVFDGFVMQRHLEGYNHRLKFCEKHFPTAIRHYRQYMQNVPESELFKVMTPVLAKLAVAIEQHHGRNLPYECYERDFSLNRHEILAKAFSCRHASEQYGPTFTHVVGSKEIDELINNRHNYLPTSSSRNAIFDLKPGSSKSDIRRQNSRAVSKDNSTQDRQRHAGHENLSTAYKSYMSSDFYPSSNLYDETDNRSVVQHVDDETYNLMVDDFLKGTLKRISGTGRSNDHRKRSASPVHNFSSGKRKSISPLRQNDIWQAYRHMVDQELHNLDERFNQYRKDPETHPSYNDEWQKFWKRRKDELVSSGLDHREYNYQPEWVRFIKIRIEELYGQEVENLKIKSRERLCLPLTNENVSDFKYQVQPSKMVTSNETMAIQCNTEAPASLSLPFQNESTPQVVSVLRLMTALEDSLGSLGPKITDLLSKALQAEKTNSSHVNAIILNDDNCSLIETAKEKFKGLVITGLFEGSKKRVLKQVVSDAEALLKYAYQSRQLWASQRSSLESSSINQTQKSLPPLANSWVVSSTLQQTKDGRINTMARKAQSSSTYTTETVLTRVDKKELASKLAASLVAQGKTDFDPQQLHQLIAVYKLIEKKKRESGTVLSNKESNTSSKKTLSDTLSDLLKSSSSTCMNPEAPNSYNALQSVHGSTDQISGGKQFSSNVTRTFQQNSLSNPTAVGNFLPSHSLASVLQNSSDNYFNNTAQSMSNVYSGGGGGNLLEQRSDYGLNNANNLSSYQQMGNVQFNNNKYQNNNGTMAQTWGWNSNMEISQNYNMGGPNNNYNQSSNWQHF